GGQPVAVELVLFAGPRNAPVAAAGRHRDEALWRLAGQRGHRRRACRHRTAGQPVHRRHPPNAGRPRAQPSWQPKSLVIILEESLGAQFIGHLGGLPLSPNLDRLSTDAWTFTRMYATGTRSVRGIEAVVAGFPPSPAQAVVKQPEAQQDFYTLAETLAARGYDTTFYYGGESHFDNMRGFFFGNGFGRVIDQNDYPAPGFTGSWGVSD